jgi:hypothetical protein
VDFILARPIASAGMIPVELGVTAQAAQAMLAKLGLRKMTERRYRVWESCDRRSCYLFAASRVVR